MLPFNRGYQECGCPSNYYRKKKRRSWTNSHRNWFCMVGPRQAVYMVTAVLVHLAYLVSYYLRWQLYSAVSQFPVSETTSATFCESSPTVQSRVQSTEYRRPFFKPRSVPFAIKEAIETELDRLEAEGILKKVTYSEYMGCADCSRP